MARFAERTGVEPARGGSHVGLGTANFVVGLGGSAYLEIVGPDPEQPTPVSPRPFGIDDLAVARIVTWAIQVRDLDAWIASASTAGYDPGPAQSMARRTPEGELLEWRLSRPQLDYGSGLIPFLIDWGVAPHPTTRGLPMTELQELHATHPDPASIQPALSALRADLPIAAGQSVSLTAVVAGVDGPVRI